MTDPFVNVKDFGAYGDGMANDTVAIQNAIDSLASNPTGGGIIFFPYGAYLVDYISVNYDKITLLGESGGTLNTKLVSNSNNDLITLNGSWDIVDGIAIDGNGNGEGGNTSGNGITVNGNQCGIYNCFIQNCAQYGIYQPYTPGANENNNIRNCKVFTCKLSGLFIDTNDIYIVNCEIANNEGTAQVIMAGGNNRIYNCHIWSGDQYTTNPNTVGIDLRGDIPIVSGCVIERNNSNGLIINPSSASPGISGAVITGNTFHQNYGYAAIYLMGSNNDSVQNVNICGNLFRNENQGTYCIAGVYGKYKNIFASGNTFDDTQSTGRYDVDMSKIFIIDNQTVINPPPINAHQQVVGTTLTTGQGTGLGGTKYDMDSMTYTFAPKGQHILVMFSGCFKTTVQSQSFGIYINISTSDVRSTGINLYTNEQVIAFQHLALVTPNATITVKIRWDANSNIKQPGTNGKERVLTIIDLP